MKMQWCELGMQIRGKVLSFIRGKSRLAVFKEVSVCSASCQTSGVCSTENVKQLQRGDRTVVKTRTAAD